MFLADTVPVEDESVREVVCGLLESLNGVRDQRVQTRANFHSSVMDQTL